MSDDNVVRLHLSRCEIGGLQYGSPPETHYAVCVNSAVVTNYVPVENLLAIANVAFEAAQAVDFTKTVRWDHDDNIFLIRLWQAHKSSS